MADGIEKHLKAIMKKQGWSLIVASTVNVCTLTEK
jgi:hypothetical protein